MDEDEEEEAAAERKSGGLGGVSRAASYRLGSGETSASRSMFVTKLSAGFKRASQQEGFGGVVASFHAMPGTCLLLPACIGGASPLPATDCLHWGGLPLPARCPCYCLPALGCLLLPSRCLLLPAC